MDGADSIGVDAIADADNDQIDDDSGDSEEVVVVVDVGEERRLLQGANGEKVQYTVALKAKDAATFS